jgi:hypothetical protein
MRGSGIKQRINNPIQGLRHNICRQLRFDREAVSRLESEGGRNTPRLLQNVPPAIERKRGRHRNSQVIE